MAVSEIEVREDPALQPEEKETIIRWANDEDRATIHSEQATVVKWLYSHPEYREENRRVSSGELHATTGTLPVGALKLSGYPRQSNYTSGVLGTLERDTE